MNNLEEKNYFLHSVVRPTISFAIAVLVYRGMVESLTRSILLPSTVLGKNKLQLEICVKTSRVSFDQRVLVNGLVDAVILKNSTDKSCKGWIIYCNANGVCYEHILNYTQRLGNKFRRNICVFNYRGVGDSLGTCNNGNEMVDDCISVIQYIKKNYPLTQDEDIILWGHSIGGAVSILAAHKLGSEWNGYIVADRSFGYLREVVKDKIEHGPLAPMISGFIASSMMFTFTLAFLLGYGYQPWPTFDDSDTTADFVRSTLSGFCLSYVSFRLNSNPRYGFLAGLFGQMILGKYFLKSFYSLDSLPSVLILAFTLAFELADRGYFLSLLLKIVSSQGWDLNPGEVLPNLKKTMITYHKEDEMIPLECSLKKLAKPSSQKVLELAGPNYPFSNHMYELGDSEILEILTFIQGN